METINLKINGIAVTAPKGTTILEACLLYTSGGCPAGTAVQSRELLHQTLHLVQPGKTLHHVVAQVKDRLVLHTCGPVSYTHLDVYKRQVHPPVPLLKPAFYPLQHVPEDRI